MLNLKLFNPFNAFSYKLFLLIFFIGVKGFNAVNAQNAKTVIRTSADLKSGNSNDVLISFFQLAINDITGDTKSFTFQTSLFGIKAKTDSTLLQKRNFLKEKFSRNFVMSVTPSLNEDFKFKSNAIGLKYAIINNRDKAIFNYFTPTNISYNQLKHDALNGYLVKYNLKVTDTDYRLASHFFYEDDDGKRTTVEKLPNNFKSYLDSLKNKTVFKNTVLKQFRDTLYNEFESLSKFVENRGLWTISSNLSSDNTGKLFSVINFNSEYLKGILNQNANYNIEINGIAAIDFMDDSTSIAVKDLNRRVFTLSGGFNWIITKNKNNKSLIEFKAAMVYNRVLKGIYTGEKNNSFTAEGIFRIRITDQVWLPFEIKYNPSTGNVFGFLSIKTNFDGLRKD